MFQPCGLVNPSIKKDINKVVDIIDVEDITEKAVFCRCWRSKNVSASDNVFDITCNLTKIFAIYKEQLLYMT